MVESEEIAGIVEAAAVVALAGMDARAFLRVRDPLEQQVMLAVASRTLDFRKKEREHLAQLIALEVGKLFG